MHTRAQPTGRDHQVRAILFTAAILGSRMCLRQLHSIEESSSLWWWPNVRGSAATHGGAAATHARAKRTFPPQWATELGGRHPYSPGLGARRRGLPGECRGEQDGRTLGSAAHPAHWAQDAASQPLEQSPAVGRRAAQDHVAAAGSRPCRTELGVTPAAFSRDCLSLDSRELLGTPLPTFLSGLAERVSILWSLNFKLF